VGERSEPGAPTRREDPGFRASLQPGYGTVLTLMVRSAA